MTRLESDAAPTDLDVSPLEDPLSVYEPFLLAERMGHLTQTKTILVGIVVLALLVRVIAAISTQSWDISPDHNHWDFGFEMGRIAGSLVAGSGFTYPTDPPQPTAWMPPAYPLFMATIFSVFGPYTPQSALVIESLQVIASAISCVLLFLLANRLYGPTVGCISASMLAIYPPSVHYSVQKIWSSTFFTMILLLALLQFTSQARRPTHLGILLLGLILGLGNLFNPLLLGIVPPMVVWLIWTWNRQGKKNPILIAILLATCGLVLTPWIIRNYVVFGRFIPIKSNLGHEILVGHYDHGTTEWSGVERQIRGLKQPITGLTMTEEELESIGQLNEVEKNRVYFKKGIALILDNPARFVRITGARIMLFWTTMRSPRNLDDVIRDSPYFVVLILGILGMYQTVRSGLPRAILIIPLLFFPVAYYVTVVGLHRYRFPVEPVLIIFASLALSTQVPHFGLKKPRFLVVSAGNEP